MDDNKAQPESKSRDKDDEKVTVYEDKVLEYVTFDKALAVRAGKVGVGLTKRTCPLIVVLHVLLEFYAQQGRNPSAETRHQDSELLRAIQTKTFEELGLDASMLSKDGSELWIDSIYGHLAPVTSVVGGMLAQDIIRAVSERGHTIRNFFFFNGLTLKGHVESIGK